MFERFTDRARRVVVLSQEESRRLAHDYIGTEHLLLALVRIDDGVSGRALAAEGVEIEAARAKAEEIVGRGTTSSPMGHIPFTPRAKKVLELGLREALALGHHYIGTEHILLGLLREGQGAGCQILASLGVEFAALEARVKTMVGGQYGAGAAAPSPSFLRRIGFGRRGGTTDVAIWQPTPEQTPVVRRFTPDALRAATLAVAEAGRLGGAATGEEHLLLGLVAQGDGRGARALTASGVTLDRARDQVVGLVGPGEGPVTTRAIGPRPPSASALAVYESALVEAEAAGRDDIDTGDLLLGLVRRAEKQQGLAAALLEAIGTTPGMLREAVAGEAEGRDEG
jgi:ATP-dependent Clp protease ATP-binding subunit ClpA